MNTNKKGDIGLLKTMLHVTLNEFFVFLPISDTTCVDLVIGNKNMELKKIQIKYCSIKKGKLEIRTSTVVNGKRVPVDLNQTDIWAIYCPDNDKIYFIDVKELRGKKALNLRIHNKSTNNNIRLASNYESLNKIFS
jgi:hypothetical protein